MTIRARIVAILAIIAVPLAFFLFDSRLSTVSYACAAALAFTLSANIPGSLHSGEIRLEGAVHEGSVMIEGLPDNPSVVPEIYTAGASVGSEYQGEMYEAPEITFTPSPGAKCDLRLTYRLKSDLSLLNPLW